MTSNGPVAKKSRNMARKSAQSDNKLRRNCLAIPFVKNGPPSALEWMTAFVPFCSDVSPFFPNGPPKQLLSSMNFPESFHKKLVWKERTFQSFLWPYFGKYWPCWGDGCLRFLNFDIELFGKFHKNILTKYILLRKACSGIRDVWR